MVSPTSIKCMIVLPKELSDQLSFVIFQLIGQLANYNSEIMKCNYEQF